MNINKNKDWTVKIITTRTKGGIESMLSNYKKNGWEQVGRTIQAATGDYQAQIKRFNGGKTK